MVCLIVLLHCSLIQRHPIWGNRSIDKTLINGRSTRIRYYLHKDNIPIIIRWFPCLKFSKWREIQQLFKKSASPSAINLHHCTGETITLEFTSSIWNIVSPSFSLFPCIHTGGTQLLSIWAFQLNHGYFDDHMDGRRATILSMYVE